MTDRTKVVLAAALSVIASLGGILVAILTHVKEDANRGGAIGTAFALIFIVLARNYGIKLYDAAKGLDELDQKPKASYTLEDVLLKIDTLRSAIIVDGDEVRKLNWWMIVTTGIAAVAAAFGDKIALSFIKT